MTVTQTSMQAYAGVKPKLGAKQLAVLRSVERHPCSSNADIAADLGWTINRVTPRSNELRVLGLVKVGGQKKNKTTGRREQWMVATEAMPPLSVYGKGARQ